MQQSHGGIPVALPGVLHKLTQNMDGVDNVRSSDGKIDESTNESSITPRIRDWIPGIRQEFVLLFHREQTRLGPYHTCFGEDIKSILPLT